MLRMPVMVAAGGVNSAGRTSRRHAYRRMVWDHLSADDRTGTESALAQMMGTQDSSLIRHHTLVREIEAEWFDEYVYWAENHFMPYGSERIEIIDFWVSTGEEAIVEGTNPIVSPNGQPNITWVAKYSNREERDAFFANLDVDPEWEKVWSKHPNPDAYIHSNARFFGSVK